MKTSNSEFNNKEQLKDRKDTKRRGRPPKKISVITEKSNVKIDKFLVKKNSAFENSSKVQRLSLVTRTRYTVEPSDGQNESIDDPSEEERDVTVINITHSESFDNGQCEREQEKLRERYNKLKEIKGNHENKDIAAGNEAARDDRSTTRSGKNPEKITQKEIINRGEQLTIEAVRKITVQLERKMEEKLHEELRKLKQELETEIKKCRCKKYLLEKVIERRDEEIEHLKKGKTEMTVTIVQLRVEKQQLEVEERQLETRIKGPKEGEKHLNESEMLENHPDGELIQGRTKYHCNDNNNHKDYNESTKETIKHYNINKNSKYSGNFERTRYNQQRGHDKRNKNWNRQQEPNQWPTVVHVWRQTPGFDQTRNRYAPRSQDPPRVGKPIALPYSQMERETQERRRRKNNIRDAHG